VGAPRIIHRHRPLPRLDALRTTVQRSGCRALRPRPLGAVGTLFWTSRCWTLSPQVASKLILASGSSVLVPETTVHWRDHGWCPRPWLVP